MHDMTVISERVATLATVCKVNQSVYDAAKEELKKAMYDEFFLRFGVKNGDRLRIGEMVGHAVIQQNGTSIGLYIRYGGHLGLSPVQPGTFTNLTTTRKQR